MASRSGIAQRCSSRAMAAVVPGGISSASTHTCSGSYILPSAIASAPSSAPTTAPSSPAAPRPTRAPATAPYFSSSGTSATSICVTLPSSSLATRSTSTRRTMSCSFKRCSSLRAAPVKFGSMKPTVRSCTGPSAIVPPWGWSDPDRSHAREDLRLLHVELGLREHALVEQRLELRQLGHGVLLAGGGCRGSRWSLLRLQFVDLLVLRLSL